MKGNIPIKLKHLKVLLITLVKPSALARLLLEKKISWATVLTTYTAFYTLSIFATNQIVDKHLTDKNLEIIPYSFFQFFYAIVIGLLAISIWRIFKLKLPLTAAFQYAFITCSLTYFINAFLLAPISINAENLNSWIILVATTPVMVWTFYVWRGFGVLGCNESKLKLIFSFLLFIPVSFLLANVLSTVTPYYVNIT